MWALSTRSCTSLGVLRMRHASVRDITRRSRCSERRSASCSSSARWARTCARLGRLRSVSSKLIRSSTETERTIQKLRMAAAAVLICSCRWAHSAEAAAAASLSGSIPDSMQLSGVGTESFISWRDRWSLKYAWSKSRTCPSCVCCSANRGRSNALTSSRRANSVSSFSRRNSSTSVSRAVSRNFMRELGGTLSRAHSSDTRAAVER
mmetsp:Transcript_10811/g.26436  ORF Transcript_10811/g.26436 Transcript_10811/m.26436 type:complete len:207 (-) Transcript_10811:5500-6120(-)